MYGLDGVGVRGDRDRKPRPSGGGEADEAQCKPQHGGQQQTQKALLLLLRGLPPENELVQRNAPPFDRFCAIRQSKDKNYCVVLKLYVIVNSEYVRCAFGTILIRRLCRHLTSSLFLLTSYLKMRSIFVL